MGHVKTSDAVETDNLHHIVQKILLLILTLGWRPHFALWLVLWNLSITLTEPKKISRVASPCELKPREERILCISRHYYRITNCPSGLLHGCKNCPSGLCRIQLQTFPFYLYLSASAKFSFGNWPSLICYPAFASAFGSRTLLDSVSKSFPSAFPSLCLVQRWKTTPLRLLACLC